MSAATKWSRSEWPLRRVSLPAGISGRLWLTEMPGRSTLLSDFLSVARELGITGVVCLVPPENITHSAPDYAAARSVGLEDMQLLDCPIPDYGLPPDTIAFQAFIGDLANRLRQGERLVIHCAAGVGRTGMAAVVLMRALGLSPADALATVWAAGSRPETPEQMKFAMEHADA
ncbi:protein-tyrosine phosphatase family protein [Paenirhodobacter populi]|uniref:Phosphatase n=1 Tax=Paenirhodobacter populi TaxID=2306993 RepID=A0A443J7N0_9RHOB|nr:tyrosine-protein phosphatase [Sinirhodobacter populi]RWR16501.1 phosphatase [Sinirhodobacter populi]